MVGRSNAVWMDWIGQMTYSLVGKRTYAKGKQGSNRTIVGLKP